MYLLFRVILTRIQSITNRFTLNQKLMESIKKGHREVTGKNLVGSENNISRFLTIQANREGGALLMQAHSAPENLSANNITRFLQIQANRDGGALLMQAHKIH